MMVRTSLGYTGVAHLAVSDGNSALYTYVRENWNVPNNDPVEDGEIYVKLEPISSARKVVRTKRYPDGIPLRWAENVDFEQTLKDGTLSVRNGSNATRINSWNIDAQAMDLLREIAFRIQRDGAFPRPWPTSSDAEGWDHTATRLSPR